MLEVENIKSNEFDKIVFLDRDGTLNMSPKANWVTKLAELVYLPLDLRTFKRITLKGYGFIIVTNQRGLNTGDIDHSEYEKICNDIFEFFGNEDIQLVSILTCPHSKECNSCRKPNPGMLNHALKRYEISPEKCWMIGDQVTDELCAKSINLPFIFVDNQPNSYSGHLSTDQALKEILVHG